MEISASMVMQLREKTGVSMMACKKALTEANGEMEKAVEILRKSGEAKAASKADRVTHEGRIFMKSNGNELGIVGIACETDFVARNEDFGHLGEAVLDVLLNEGEEAAKTKADQMIKELIVKLGENMSLTIAKKVSGHTWGLYVHSNNKLGAFVSLASGTDDQAKDVAMHVAATNPQFLSPDDVDQVAVDKEVEIMKEQLKNEGKPENIWDKILEGKVKKFREERALLTQPFVKDPSMTIEKYLNGVAVEKFEYVAL